MTPRERILKVIRGGIPDRVPVIPGFGTWYASRIYGGDLFDVEEGRLSATEMMAGLTLKYGCDMWYWQGCDDSISEKSIDGKQDSLIEKVWIDQDNYNESITLITPSGRLNSVLRHNRINPVVQLTGFIKNPESDWPVYHEFMGDTWEFGTTTTLMNAPRYALDLGVSCFVILLPIDFWKDLRCDTMGFIIDLYDAPSSVEEALQWHCHHALAMLDARLKIAPLPDMIHLAGSSSSLSVISPQLYRKYNLNFIQQVCNMAHSRSVPVQIHHCGKSAKLVEILYDNTDVDIIHPLEPPPGGDVDLALVKKRFGDRIVLMGNLNTFDLMMHSSPLEIKEAVRKAIDQAAEGGRFILSNGDQLGRDTPEENIIAMVESAHEFGHY